MKWSKWAKVKLDWNNNNISIWLPVGLYNVYTASGMYKSTKYVGEMDIQCAQVCADEHLIALIIVSYYGSTWNCNEDNQAAVIVHNMSVFHIL